MKASKALKWYCFLGLILSGIAGGIIGVFFEKHSNLSTSDVFSTVLLGGSILLCILILKDVRDQKKPAGVDLQKRKFLHLIRSEFQSLKKEIRNPTTRLGMLAYFLWATSQYSILILFADFQTKYTYTVIMMMSGYLVGVAILGFCNKISDEKIIRAGFFLTIGSFITFFIIDLFVENKLIITAISGCLYSMGNAFLSPSMLSLFSKERVVHQQGKGFGLIVSTDSGGFLAASIIAISLNQLNIQIEYVFLLSLITFAISWIPYSQYEKRRKNISRTPISQK